MWWSDLGWSGLESMFLLLLLFSSLLKFATLAEVTPVMATPTIAIAPNTYVEIAIFTLGAVIMKLCR